MRGTPREFGGARISDLAWRVSGLGHTAKLSEAVCKDCFLHVLHPSSKYVHGEAQGYHPVSSSVAHHLTEAGSLAESEAL